MSNIDDAAAQLAAAEAAPQRNLAMIEEVYCPVVIDVSVPEPGETPLGQPPILSLTQFVGPVRPGLFVTSKVAKIYASDALKLGEHLADEARKAMSGLEVVRQGAGKLL